MIGFAPGAAAPAVHVYATGDEYVLLVSVPPVEPDHPLVSETFGNTTEATPDWVSLAVAFRLNDPVPAGLNQSVPPL